jgi:hypothetical protein
LSATSEAWHNRAIELELLNLESPSEVRTFEKGRFEIYRVGPTTLGRATYEPGWRWSEHVGRATGERWCMVEHVGLVQSDADFFYVPPGHDSWVVGEEPYVSLHILGSETYAAS